MKKSIALCCACAIGVAISSAANAAGPNLTGLEPIVEPVEGLLNNLGASTGLNGLIGEGSGVNNLLDKLVDPSAEEGTSAAEDDEPITLPLVGTLTGFLNNANSNGTLAATFNEGDAAGSTENSSQTTFGLPSLGL